MSVTVLIVDDEDTARSFVSQALGDAGYDTLEAGSLAQALQAIEAGAADVILLDVSLPDGSGLSLLDRIARENPSPPVIIITAFGEVEMAVEAMKRGAQDFLQKPLDFERMLRAVERAREIVALRRELDLLRRASERLAGVGRRGYAGHAAIDAAKPSGPPPPAFPCSSPARPGRARRSWRRPFAAWGPAPTSPSCPSTAPPCPTP